MKKLFTNLTFWVLSAITIGVLLGYFDPETAVTMQPLGTYFIEIVKLFINPIIFLTISLGISGMGRLRQVGKIGGKALLYFEIITTAALLIGILVSGIIQPGKGINASSVHGVDVSKFTSAAQSFTWIDFFQHNLTIQVLLISIVFGIYLSKSKHRLAITKPLNAISKYVFKALHWVMIFAPIGAFGGIAYTIGKFGISSLLPLASLMLTVYITMGIFIFVLLGLLLQIYKISILKFLKYIRQELLIVLGTSSSETALPLLMEKLEKMGCPKSIVGLVVPAGYSFNLDGTTIYLSMAVLFLAQVYNINLDWSQMLTIIGVLMITSKGAAGVTGSGFVVLASTLSVVNVIPVEGLALLLGIDRFMSEARSITNFIGNGVATVLIANHENEFDANKMELAFSAEIHTDLSKAKDQDSR